jgi:hypothetical protein
MQMEEHSDSTRPLPDMLGDVPPEHDLRGRMIVLTIYACGTLVWAGFVFEGDEGPGPRLVFFIAGALIFVWTALVARAVERFACWSWFFVAGAAVLALPGAAGALVYDDLSGSGAVAAAAGVMLSLGTLHYLWVRRRDFWIDARLERLRPRSRVVTPEWRAARLARIGTQSVCARRRVSPRPGALWMHRTGAAGG